MNIAILVGNLTKDPETKTTSNGVSCCTFTIACQRSFTNSQGVREADFINCVAWRGTADFIARYFHKGSKIGIRGTIQTRTYDAQDGTKRFATEVQVENAEFVQSGNGGQKQQNEQPMNPNEIPADVKELADASKFVEVTDDELPF